MKSNAQQTLAALEGRAWAIADAVRREVENAAPYAEFGLSLGVPTWFLHERVLSLTPFTESCMLQFWHGDALAEVLPFVLKPTRSAPMRSLRLRSLLDVDATVAELIAEAFALQIRRLASDDAASCNAALPR